MIKKFILAALFLATLTGCSTSSSDYQKPQHTTPATTTTPTSQKLVSRYQLRPLDLLEIKVFQEPDLSKTVRIAIDGSIDLHLVGRIQINGLTLNEAQDMITDLYRKEYLVNPQISLFILEHSKQRVHVIGQVMRQGEVIFPPEEAMTLSKAIGDCGGFTRIANRRDITVKRRLPDGAIQTFNLDLVKILTDKNAADFHLQDGDLIEVAEAIL